MKRCGACGEVKPYGDFHRQTRARDGRQSKCKPCSKAQVNAWNKANPDRAAAGSLRRGRRQYAAAPERFAERSRQYRARAPEAVRRTHIKSRYGLTPEQYEWMLGQQGGCCAICSTTEPGGGNANWSVDHDHACCPGIRSCGQCIRGLLCSPCNTGLGQFNDDAERLIAAAAYLKTSQEIIANL